MLKDVQVRKTAIGKGLFVKKAFGKGELIFKVDLTKLKVYTAKEISDNQKLQSDHCDYVGRGNYVISFHPYSYINHSCNPNVLVKHHSIAKSSFIAMQDIKKGEELTYDYGVNALDQIGKGTYVTKGKRVMKCKCRSENCRLKIWADFFKQPIEIQRKYYACLPPQIRRKYKNKFKSSSKQFF